MRFTIQAYFRLFKTVGQLSRVFGTLQFGSSEKSFRLALRGVMDQLAWTKRHRADLRKCLRECKLRFVRFHATMVVLMFLTSS
jgi:hypothetical protein